MTTGCVRMLMERKGEVRNQIWYGIWELGGWCRVFMFLWGYRFLICLSLCCLMCIKGGGDGGVSVCQAYSTRDIFIKQHSIISSHIRCICFKISFQILVYFPFPFPLHWTFEQSFVCVRFLSFSWHTYIHTRLDTSCVCVCMYVCQEKKVFSGSSSH